MSIFHKMFSILKILLIFITIFYLAIILFVIFFQSGFIYFPMREILHTPNDINLEYKDIMIKTSDKRYINAWLIPNENSDKYLLFCHGNAGNISHRLDSIKIFHNLNLNILIFDYAGYGKSEGTVNETATYEDVKSCWNYLVNVKKVKPHNIILFGRSIGASIAAWLAHKKNPGALVVESGFISVLELARLYYSYLPVKLITRFNYNTLDYIKKVKCPKLIIHSIDDEMIPYSHGKTLFNMAYEPKEMLKITGGHNDGFIISKEKYIKGIKNFLMSLRGYGVSEVISY